VRAAGFSRYGGPDVVELTELPEPEPGPGQIRIRVAAATVNPADVLFRGGGLAAAIEGPPPHVAGLELAGTVDAAGQGARLHPGDNVVAMTKFIPSGRGAHAELVVVHRESAARAPANIAPVAAATLPMNGLTVRLALDRLGLVPGSTILVTGAAGAIGGYAVQLAIAEGLRVVAIAGDADDALVRGFGAELVIPRGEHAAEAVRQAFPSGVDAAIDAACLGSRIFPALRDRGRIVALRSFAGETDRGISVELVSVRQYLYEAEKLEHLVELTEAGRLTTRVAETFPLERAAEAHARVEHGGLRGRVVLEL
jgi:NADPH:quinone reductase-like Zn-dependent oxidoreductase